MAGMGPQTSLCNESRGGVTAGTLVELRPGTLQQTATNKLQQTATNCNKLHHARAKSILCCPDGVLRMRASLGPVLESIIETKFGLKKFRRCPLHLKLQRVPCVRPTVVKLEATGSNWKQLEAKMYQVRLRLDWLEPPSNDSDGGWAAIVG